MKTNRIFLFVLIFYTKGLLANQTPPSWISDGPYLEDSHASFEVPIEVLATKMYVEIEIGDKRRRFVIDTGSPSMIDSALVEELGLKVVGTNKGRDAHGVVVETKIVQTNIKIGDTSFKNVPIMATNFSASPATKAFLGDGVLGSELLSLGAWQIDLEDSVLRFNTRLQSLPNIKKSKRLKLYQFGYPYTPIFDVTYAKRARSKAMLDTGSPTFFSISSSDLDGTKKANGIGKTLYGYGSPGRSLGGQAPETELLQVELTKLAIDKLKLGRVVAGSRELSPSLIGAKILDRYIVTLDSRSESAYFKEYADGLFTELSFGFSLTFNNNISIGAVWEDSPAKAAGLQSGLEVISINGVGVELTKEGLMKVAKAMEEQEIELEWKGGAAKLTRKYLIPLE